MPASATEKLRQAITDALYDVKAYSLPSVCVGFGLASGDKDEAFNSKRLYVWHRIASLSGERLLAVAKAVVAEYPSQALEEAIDLAQPPKRPVSELVRRRIGDALNEVELAGRTPLLDVLRRLFPVD